MTVDYMLSNMSQNELLHWMAYHKMKNEEYEKEREESASKTKSQTSSKDTVKDLRTNKPVKHYQDMPIGEDGYRVVTEEEQNVADSNMLLFFQRYAKQK